MKGGQLTIGVIKDNSWIMLKIDYSRCKIMHASLLIYLDTIWHDNVLEFQIKEFF